MVEEIALAVFTGLPQFFVLHNIMITMHYYNSTDDCNSNLKIVV